MSIPVTDISSFLGLSATAVLTGNFLLGILLSTAYKRNPYWRKLPGFIKKISIIKVHNVSAYIALGLIVLHPLVLVFDPATKFGVASILVPFAAPVQQVWVTLGIVAMYSMLLVIITTQKVVRKMMGYRLWKNIHLFSYIALVAVSLHGVFMDPELKNRQPDFIDAEKLVSEGCLAVLLLALILRFRYYRLHQKLFPPSKSRITALQRLD